MKNFALLLLISLFLVTTNTSFAQGCLTFQASTEIVESGDTARLDIRVKDFNSILALQYTMKFDPSELQFIEIGNFNLPSLQISNFGIFPDDRITMSWLDPVLSGISQPDSSIIYSVWFKVLHPEGTASTFSFSDSPTAVEVVQVLPEGDNLLAPAFINGQIHANSNSGLSVPTIDAICSTSENCSGSAQFNSIDLDISGGTPPYTFTWSNDSGGNYNSEDLENVPQGKYNVTISDQNNLQASALVFLFDDSSFPLAVEAVLTNANCDDTGGGISLTVGGGSGDYSYLWNEGSTSSSISDLAAGTYSVTITDNNSACAISESYTINTDTDFGLSINADQPTCGQANGGIELLLLTPGDYTFNWNNGASTQNITNLSQGQYQVSITENNTGCQYIQSFDLAEAPFLPGASYQCEYINDDMVNVSTTVAVWSGGRPPYTFAWSNGSVQTDSLLSTITVTQLVSDPQIYTVTITDATGCTFEPVTVEADCNTTGPTDVDINTTPVIAGIGESFCVDITVGDFNDIIGMQFSMEWNSDVIQLDSISNYSLPNGNPSNFGDPEILGPGVLNLAWFDSALDGVSLPDGSSIFQLCFTALANGTTKIDITDTPTLIEITDVNDNNIPLNSGTSTITVTGAPNIDASFNLVNPTCGQANGDIELTLEEPGDFSFLWNTGATTQNLINQSPGQYQVTITDNNSGDQSIYPIELTEVEFISATAYECAFFNDDIVHITSTAAVWSGGRAPYTFTWSDGSVETDSLFSSITVSTLTTLPQSYTVTITDATGCSYEPLTVEPDCTNSSSNDIVLSASDANAEVGETVCLDISASGFNDVASLQFSMDWDASKLAFESIQSLNLPDLTLNNFNAEAELMEGILRFAWLDNTTQGISISDNSVLFQLCLTALDGPANVPVNFSNDPIPQEAINGDLESINIAADNGSVSILTDGSNMVQLTIGEDIGIPGQQVCLPVTCEDFTGVVSMQFSINWDPTIIEYEDIIFGSLPALSSSNIGILDADNGDLRVSWLDPNTTGVTLPDGTTLFEICFVPPGAPGVSTVEFSNNPIPIEFIDAQTNSMDFLGSPGQVTVPTNLVWPGDTDASDLVNHFDLLNIGLAFGSTGASREDASIEWMAQYTEEWDQETPETGINFKHADADGNGLVDAMDTLAIIQNWGEVTDFWNDDEEDQFGNPEASNLMDIPIYILPDTIIPGETVDFSIILGNDNIPANDVYGIAFTIIYDPEVIVENSAKAQFMESWMGDVNSDLLGIYRDNYNNNKIDIAITRTDLSNVSGQGVIGALHVTIEDVIFQRSEDYKMHFEIENVRLISAEEVEIPISPEGSFSIILEETTGANTPEWAQSLNLYPIPAKDLVHLDAGALQIEGLNLFSTEGKLLKQFDPQNNTMNIANLPNGLYLLQIITEQGVITRRVEKQY